MNVIHLGFFTIVIPRLLSALLVLLMALGIGVSLEPTINGLFPDLSYRLHDSRERQILIASIWAGAIPLLLFFMLWKDAVGAEIHPLWKWLLSLPVLGALLAVVRSLRFLHTYRKQKEGTMATPVDGR
jgi:hypothetical protein